MAWHKKRGPDVRRWGTDTSGRNRSFQTSASGGLCCDGARAGSPGCLKRPIGARFRAPNLARCLGDPASDSGLLFPRPSSSCMRALAAGRLTQKEEQNTICVLGASRAWAFWEMCSKRSAYGPFATTGSPCAGFDKKWSCRHGAPRRISLLHFRASRPRISQISGFWSRTHRSFEELRSRSFSG